VEKEKAPSLPEVSGPPAVEPGPACEKEVPHYEDGFTLSGGCCSGD